MFTPRNVAVIIGIGGIGLSAARRLGNGRLLFLADNDAEKLKIAAETLAKEGYSVQTHDVNVADFASVKKLAHDAATINAGHIDAIVSSAGVAPIFANVKSLYEVNLLGHANVIEAFNLYVSPNTSGVIIAGVASRWGAPLDNAFAKHLATSPAKKILEHPKIVLDDGDYNARIKAYAIAEKGTQLRVEAAAVAWGAKGARINTISPGAISTPMLAKEMEGTEGDAKLKQMIHCSALKRIGTPEDIGSIVEFLVSQSSSFITGTDILIDGGAHSSMFWEDHQGVGTHKDHFS